MTTHTEKMNQTISIRLNDEDEASVREIKEKTGATMCQVLRMGLQTIVAQFKRDGFLKMPTKDQKP